MAARKIVHVAGFESCGFFFRALQVLKSVSILFPNQIKVVPHSFADRSHYRNWLIDEGFRLTLDHPRAVSHSSSPFVWIQTDPESETKHLEFIGGHDNTLDWCRSILSPSSDSADDARTQHSVMADDGQTNSSISSSHNAYDYDLVVIGGGSGGLAAAKEASILGAKVACLDYVKPSPLGTTWGLGGTCVNVGCIPKKLFHIGSLLKEGIEHDTPSFGLAVGKTLTPPVNEYGEVLAPAVSAHWEVLRENVQNYIKGLNFKHRVRLREKNVTYLNALGTFVDAHTIEAMDKNGVKSVITAARFLVAVGGRPAPLDCEGGDFAISSDDVFALGKPPGKTLCVGASYISLECAGFLAALGNPVTVAVRSILLRGFDRECVNRIDQFMQARGVHFKRQVLPSKLVKTEDNRIKVTFSDGSEDVFDTVFVAIGRFADTSKLGLDRVGVQVNPKNHKIIGSMEQSSCSNIYAVGDVLDGTPELTPVAIQAGILLARRLFGGSKVLMDYKNVCTTVFTPIEYACVGYSEDQAIEVLGEKNVEVYHREFHPLEWSLSHYRGSGTAFTKAIVDKTQNNKIIGIHFVGPNAGEVMQGYGVAIRKGITYNELTDTVGIHPTSAEEIVALSITKRSGEDAAAGGC